MTKQRDIMRTHTPKGVVVFDLDGTLVNTAEDIAFSINHFRQKKGLEILSTASVLRSVGRGASFLIQQTLNIEADDSNVLKSTLSAFQKHYIAHQGQRSQIYTGVEHALTVLSREYDLYVLSNKPHAATVNEMEKHHLKSRFEEVWGAGSFPHLKPNPTGVHHAIKLSKSTPDRTVMVGDLWIDIQTGMNAGVHTLFANWGFGKGEDLTIDPSAKLTTPDQLVEAIETFLVT